MCILSNNSRSGRPVDGTVEGRRIICRISACSIGSSYVVTSIRNYVILIAIRKRNTPKMWANRLYDGSELSAEVNEALSSFISEQARTIIECMRKDATREKKI
jgi:hypothetical protein